MSTEPKVCEFTVLTVLEEHQVRQHLPTTGLDWEALDLQHEGHSRARCQVTLCGEHQMWGFRVTATYAQWVDLEQWLRSIAPPYR